MADAHINLGGILEERGEVEDALVHYEKALALPSQQTYVEVERESARVGRPVVKATSTHAVALIKLGKAYIGLNRLDEAHAILTKALEQTYSGDPEPSFYLGLVCIKNLAYFLLRKRGIGFELGLF